MKILAFFFVCSLFLLQEVSAQYYYKDIVSNDQVLNDMRAYRENKIRTINIKSFEDDGSPNEGFFCQKKISRDYSKYELFTKSDISAPSLLTSYFNTGGRVIKNNDSSSLAISNNSYRYDSKGRLVSVLSSIKSDDDDFRTEMIEEHIYLYNQNDLPEKMIRVRNYRDSVTILFALNEQNLIGIEKDSKNGSKYYYYYDAKNRLSDVVQSNDLKHGLLPIYVFEYNNANLITQMTTSEEGIANYTVWKYTYENGLRIKEKCYTKERRLLGTIEYEYK